MNGNKYKILIIEDDEHINNLVATLLEANGYQTLSAYSCEDGMMMYASHRPDLVVLDLGLPDQDGMTFLKRLRKDSLTPVIVLSARSDEKDKVEALDMGANDYVTKPFGSNEFLARIRSTLRMTTHRMQNGMFPGGKFKASGLTIDYDARRVFLHKKEVKLTQTEYNIIAALSEHAGKVMTYSAIIKEIWGYNDEGSIKKLQVNMVNIRKKLGARPGEKNYIVNELVHEKLKSFDKWCDFKRRVLDVAVNEINEKSDISVKYDLMRSGRGGKIYGIDFEVTKKDMNVEPTVEEEVPTPDDVELDDLIDKVMDIIDEKIKISQAKALLKVANYDINKIEYAYELACKQENIRNLIGWMTSAIQNGYEDNPIHKVKGQAPEETVEFDEYMEQMRLEHFANMEKESE